MGTINLTVIKFIKCLKNILTVSVGCANMQVGSLQLGQFLHLTFLVATLLAKNSFCSSGVNLLKASISSIFFFCSSVNSWFSTWGCSSFAPSLFSLFSSVVPSLLPAAGFLVGNFFLNLLKNYIIMSILFFIFFIFEFFLEFFLISILI